MLKEEASPCERGITVTVGILWKPCITKYSQILPRRVISGAEHEYRVHFVPQPYFCRDTVGNSDKMPISGGKRRWHANNVDKQDQRLK